MANLRGDKNKNLSDFGVDFYQDPECFYFEITFYYIGLFYQSLRTNSHAQSRGGATYLHLVPSSVMQFTCMLRSAVFTIESFLVYTSLTYYVQRSYLI